MPAGYIILFSLMLCFWTIVFLLGLYALRKVTMQKKLIEVYNRAALVLGVDVEPITSHMTMEEIEEKVTRIAKLQADTLNCNLPEIDCYSELIKQIEIYCDQLETKKRKKINL